MIIAPDKPEYLKDNWIAAISIFLPALALLRIFWIFRFLNFAKFLRSVVLLRLLTSIRRGVKAVSLILSQRGLGYAIALTIIVIFTGAAGMSYFESPDAVHQVGYSNATGLRSYWDALWWTAMIMTTMGSQYWPVTIEGRILCWLLAVYAFVFFTYITATIASQTKDNNNKGLVVILLIFCSKFKRFSLFASAEFIF
jgi:voltage-gated potassium channel